MDSRHRSSSLRRRVFQGAPRINYRLVDCLALTRSSVVDVGLALWSMQRTQAVPRPGWPTALRRTAVRRAARRGTRVPLALGRRAPLLVRRLVPADRWSPPPPRCRPRPGSPSARRCTCCPSTTRCARPPGATHLHALFGERFELGVGLGYRDEEYDGVGLARNAPRPVDGRRPGRADRRAGPAGAPHPSVWVGGMAPGGDRRAAATRAVAAAAADPPPREIVGAGRAGAAPGRPRGGQSRRAGSAWSRTSGSPTARRPSAPRTSPARHALPRVRRFLVVAQGRTRLQPHRSCWTSRCSAPRTRARRPARASARGARPNSSTPGWTCWR